MLLQQAGWIVTDIENLTVTILALDSSCNNDLKYVLLIPTSNKKLWNATILSSAHLT